MNLDDISTFADIDPQNMLAEIDGLPDQLKTAWELGKGFPLPSWEGVQGVLLAGMGGSAIGADLLAAYTAPTCSVPVVVHRNYTLPGWAHGPETLVITSSHSGNTEETISVFNQAVERGCRILVVCTGGKLASAAQEHGAALWQFHHQGQPRAAVGYSFGLLLAAFSRLGLLAGGHDLDSEIASAVEALKAQQPALQATTPVVHNPAKRLAGQCLDRWVVVIGEDHLAPVARRWKGQVSELAKAWAQFEFLPEADHNTQAGVVNPEAVLAKTAVLFLRGSTVHPRNQLRVGFTKEIMMLAGLGTDIVEAQGDTPLAQMWTALHFGDYFAYYLAMLYGVDPTPVEAIQELKARMSAHPAP